MSHESKQGSEEYGATGREGAVAERLTAYGGRAGDAIVYSSAHLAVVATVEVAVVMLLLSLPASPAPLVVGLATFAVYAHDRVADADTDAASDPERSAFVRRHGSALYVAGSAAYGLAVALSALGGPAAVAVTLLPGAVWIAYARDAVAGFGARVRRLKEVAVVNSAVVALAWATTLTALPVAFADVAVTPATAVVFGYLLLRSFVDAEIPNVDDVAADRADGVTTLPVALGVPATRRALYGVDLLTAGFVAWAVAASHLSVGVAAALGVGVCYSVCVVALLGRADADLVSLASEGEYLVVAAALVCTLTLA